jgi:hypothetical protein
MSLRILASFLIGNLIGSSLLSTPVFAQSLNVKKPAPLQSGPNSGTVDNTVGAHYWYFYAEPGSFSGTITRLSGPGESVRANISAGIAYAPKVPGNTLVSKDNGDKTNFSGTVKTRSKVILMLDPGGAGLVRAACNYNIVVTGNVAYGEPSSLPEIAGTYESMTNGLGLTKFLPDGTLITATGIKGTWTLFDADTKTYLVKVNDDSFNLKLIPAQGLVDANNTAIVSFKMLH